MYRMYMGLLLALAAGAFLTSWCTADTFSSPQSDEVITGFAVPKIINNKTIVRTTDSGIMKLDLRQYDVQYSPAGRRGAVTVIPITEAISIETETAAIEKALIDAANHGSLFIILQIDSPGGRIDLAKRLCAAIAKTNRYCPVAAYIGGGKHGGAYSAAAMVALACEKIYMTPGTAIGAASPIVSSSSGIRSIEDAYGKSIGQKFISAFKGYVASLAQKYDRPSLLAMAMTDKSIEVIEVTENDMRDFIDPADKRPSQSFVRTWSSKDTLLTLPATEAVECSMANKIVQTQDEILEDFNAANIAKVRFVTNRDIAKARRQFEKAQKQLETLSIQIDYQIKKIESTDNSAIKQSTMSGIIKNYNNVISLSKRFPSLGIDFTGVQMALNIAKAEQNRLRNGG